jgi:putative inorganic carbon (hco3(-)) transporter
VNPGPGRFGFLLVIVFLLFDYGRPQDTVPVIGLIRPSLILTVLLAIVWLRHRKSSSVASPQISLMLAMLALMTLHIPFAVNHYWAFQSAEDFLLLLPFCVCVIMFVNSPQRVLSFMRWWVMLALLVAVKAVLNPAGRVGSSFLGDPNDVSLLLDMMLPFVLCMFVYQKSGTVKLIYLGIAVVCVAGIVSTASRGGFLGLLAVMVVSWWVSPRKILVLVVLCIAVAVAYKVTDQKYIDRITTIQSTEEGTAKGRLDSWKAAWAMFEDHPLGVGPANFGIRFPEYQGTAFGRHGMWGRAAHSLWFTLLAELGVPGAILYVLMFRANWRSLKRLKELPPEASEQRLARLLCVAYAASLAGFFAAGTFVSVLYYPHYWFVSAMIVATERALAPPAPVTLPQAADLSVTSDQPSAS